MAFDVWHIYFFWPLTLLGIHEYCLMNQKTFLSLTLSLYFVCTTNDLICWCSKKKSVNNTYLLSSLSAQTTSSLFVPPPPPQQQVREGGVGHKPKANWQAFYDKTVSHLMISLMTSSLAVPTFHFVTVGLWRHHPKCGEAKYCPHTWVITY